MAHHLRRSASMGITAADLVPVERLQVQGGRSEQLLPALGIDFGEKFIGIALAAAPLAQPLTLVANDDQALAYICTLIDDYQIKTVVIGIAERRTARLTKQFATRLAATVSVRIEYADETLSTQVAMAKLRAAGRRLQPDERVDHYAAAQLLQDWLDEREAV